MANLMDESKVLETSEVEELMATCISRTLPPALTLEYGLDEIQKALHHLKSSPPFATAGMYRFQVHTSPFVINAPFVSSH